MGNETTGQTHKVTTWVSNSQYDRIKTAVEKYAHIGMCVTKVTEGAGETRITLYAKNCGRNQWYQKLVQFMIHAFALPMDMPTEPKVKKKGGVK